jgi:hypothetical protein
MKNFLSRSAVAAIAFALVAIALPAADKASEGSWTGYVTETHCGAAGAKEGHADCAVKCVKEKGAKWALYNPEDKGIFVLSGDEATMGKMADMAGKKVTVKGSMEKEKKVITVSSMNSAS